MTEQQDNKEMILALHEAHRQNNAEEIARISDLIAQRTAQRLYVMNDELATAKIAIANEQPAIERRSTVSYKELIRLYREAVQLAKDISNVKKIIRESKKAKP